MNATCGLGISCGFRISGLLSMEECKNQSDPSAWRRDNSRGVAAHAPGRRSGDCGPVPPARRRLAAARHVFRRASTAGWTGAMPHSSTARHSSTRRACAGPVSPSSTTGSAAAVARARRSPRRRHHSQQIVAARLTASSNCSRSVPPSPSHVDGRVGSKTSSRLSLGSSSNSRTINSPRRADVRQWISRGLSPPR